MNEVLKNLPKVDEFLNDERVVKYGENIAHNGIMRIIREEIQKAREEILARKINTKDKPQLFLEISGEVIRKLEALSVERLQVVINATGIIIHTNLGRAPLSKKAAQAVYEISSSYNNLEYSTATGKRRNRLSYLEKMVADLTGAEDALVVNNNAAAVFLALNSIANNKEVVLSRGEMVEIGDSFRVSEIIEASGCKVVEVGTTNKTYASDYEKAITNDTQILLKVHTSNYKIVGYTSAPTASELAEIAKVKGLISMEDMGSGVLVDLSTYGLPYERQVQNSVAEGVDIVTFSGDKMLGGPQAGIIVGRKKYIAEMRKNQLLRCLRLDKLSLCALIVTFTQYFSSDKMVEIPVLNSMLMPIAEVLEKAQKLESMLKTSVSNFDFSVGNHVSQIGGGSLPDENIESFAIYVSSEKLSANNIINSLRKNSVPIIGTLKKDFAILDVRTIFVEDFQKIVDAFVKMI